MNDLIDGIARWIGDDEPQSRRRFFGRAIQAATALASSVALAGVVGEKTQATGEASSKETLSCSGLIGPCNVCLGGKEYACTECIFPCPGCMACSWTGCRLLEGRTCYYVGAQAVA